MVLVKPPWSQRCSSQAETNREISLSKCPRAENSLGSWPGNFPELKLSSQGQEGCSVTEAQPETFSPRQKSQPPEQKPGRDSAAEGEQAAGGGGGSGAGRAPGPSQGAPEPSGLGNKGPQRRLVSGWLPPVGGTGMRIRRLLMALGIRTPCTVRTDSGRQCGGCFRAPPKWTLSKNKGTRGPVLS